MDKSKVAVIKYEKPYESVKRAVDLCGGLDHLPSGANVFIKPNIVFWTSKTPFPKYGVITTSRVIEDMVVLLKERGVDNITIGEGSVTLKPKDRETPAHAHETLGYNVLKKKYGVKSINVFEHDFVELDLGGGVVLNFCEEAVTSDFLVNIPVLKTHAQTVTSCGIKNLKGLIDVASRKKCHNADPDRNLDYHIARLANKMPPMFTIADGIYTIERGPSFDGKAHRSNILIGSTDVFGVDKVGATLLGHDPGDVPHLVQAGLDRNRPLDLSDVEVVGDPTDELTAHHEDSFAYTEDGALPVQMRKMGIDGLDYYKYDDTMCTYCSGINGIALAAIAMAWKGEKWDDVEILTGKKMQPRPGKKHTILLGKCMWELHRDNPNIQHMIAIKGCPPQPKTIVKALHEAGVMVDPAIFDNVELAPGFFLKRYKDKPDFDESFYRITE